jgi:hypothetical protein
MLNSRGHIHIIIMVILALAGLLVANSFFRGGGDSSAPAPIDPQLDRDSAEFVRQTAYSAIDLHAKMMKMQVDLAIKAWDSLSPEQKRQARDRILAIFKSGIQQGQDTFGGIAVSRGNNLLKWPTKGDRQ